MRFQVTAEPASAGYCHCTRCQRRTGTAASVQARLAPGSFHLLAGEELVREYAPGDGWAKCFCSVCGSALWSKYPDTGDVGSVRLGLFDPGHGIRPTWHAFVTTPANGNQSPTTASSATPTPNRDRRD